MYPIPANYFQIILNPQFSINFLTFKIFESILNNIGMNQKQQNYKARCRF
ncbi:UNKNOWN [Stylonychia lemnae]|uniref:Uncharacterized protein n=1 Tax=Stylonychia lemnae TaxID=5949 RepID=A0A078AD22_STYLE|nr:UNKNOWN [Stylonychia lemnae]|eukprot:CDW79751.1 UNKNOWN [Stylonychia lemnae]